MLPPLCTPMVPTVAFYWGVTMGESEDVVSSKFHQPRLKISEYILLKILIMIGSVTSLQTGFFRLSAGWLVCLS